MYVRVPSKQWGQTISERQFGADDYFLQGQEGDRWLMA